MNPLMRAKLQVVSVIPGTTSNQVKFSAVSGAPFGSEGESEDNSYARWTPCATLDMTISNPDLLGKIQSGQKFYVDFTPADVVPGVNDGDVRPAEQS